MRLTNVFCSNNNIYKIPILSIILNDYFPPKIRNKANMSNHASPVQHNTGGARQCCGERKRSKINKQIFLFADDIIIYIENPRNL